MSPINMKTLAALLAKIIDDLKLTKEVLEKQNEKIEQILSMVDGLDSERRNRD